MISLLFAATLLLLWSFLGLYAVVAIKDALHPRRVPAWLQLLISGPLVWAIELSTWWHQRGLGRHRRRF